MIIHRLANAIRHQNWSQIITEILIVIVGIYLGLQVTDWNDERAERVEEQKYLNRMHIEVMENLNFTLTNFDAIVLLEEFQRTQRLLVQLSNVLAGADTETVLDHNHCLAVLMSHIQVDQATSLPTMTELLASGQMSIIESEDIKLALSQYSMAFEGLKGFVSALSPQALDLSRKYPDLIELDHRMSNIRLVDQFQHQCDFEKMKESIPFKNDVLSNNARLTGFVQTFEKQQEMLIAVHDELDAELEVAH